ELAEIVVATFPRNRRGFVVLEQTVSLGGVEILQVDAEQRGVMIRQVFNVPGILGNRAAVNSRQRIRQGIDGGHGNAGGDDCSTEPRDAARNHKGTRIDTNLRGERSWIGNVSIDSLIGASFRATSSPSFSFV